MVEKKICPARLRKRRLLDSGRRGLSIVRQCELLGLPRSTCYYLPRGESAKNLALMRAIDEQYLATPFYGSRRMAVVLGVNRKRVSAADADDGDRGDLSAAADDAAGGRAQDLPVFTAEYGGGAAGPGVEQRHHVRAACVTGFCTSWR